jgi:hypothetical protein
MIDSQTMLAELQVRRSDGFWALMQESRRPEGTIEIDCIGCQLKMANIFEGVELPSL